jgi:hypothetical protein
VKQQQQLQQQQQPNQRKQNTTAHRTFFATMPRIMAPLCCTHPILLSQGRERHRQRIETANLAKQDNVKGKTGL